METRRIGSLQVSAVGLGCNNFGRRVDYESTLSVVDAALDSGINFFDTADIYGGTKSEEFLGRALEGRRDRIILATKFGMAVDEHRKGGRPDYVRRALHDSLRRLRTDRIDLYQFHEPDPRTPVSETLAVLDELVRSGMVREIGCSNFSARQLREAETAAGPGAARFASLQNEYSLLHREPEPEALGECERQDVAFIPYFPLAGGLLSGKYTSADPAPRWSRLFEAGSRDRFLNDRNRRIARSLHEFAKFRGRTLLELSVSWLTSHPSVASVIAGATSPEQVRANAGAAGWRLTEEELAQVEAIAPFPD